MAWFIVFCLIMANPLLISAMAAAAAENEGKQLIAEALTAGRKLGRNHNFRSKIAAPPSPAPSPAAEALELGESGSGAEEEVMERNHSQHHHRHRSFEKSVIGGVAVVGVLAAVFLTAVFCYIRATRRRPVQPGSPADSSSSERKLVESGSLAMK